jgi:zinc protease
VTIDRSRLPEPGAVRPFAFPSIAKSVLRSGLRVWSVRHAAVPVATFVLLLRRGSASDPVGKEGLAALTVDMLDEGSGDRTAIEMHEALANLGAQFDTDIGADAAAATMIALGRFANRGLTVVADIVARPALTEADFERVRQLRLHRLTQLRDVPGAVADRIFIKLLYGTHPYGHTSMGTEMSLAALTVGDVHSFHAQSIRPDVATLVAVGDCDHAQIEGMAADAFAGWESAGEGGGAPGDGLQGIDALPGPPGGGAPDLSARLFIVPRPGAPQSELRIGHVGVARSTPDYHPLVAANMILGGQFVSRINLNLRENKGFTYGARTAFDFRRMAGPFSLQASVQTAATARAIEESLGEIAAIRGPRPVTAEELALGVAALTRGYARNFETAEQVARAATQIALYDLPDDYFVQFVPNVERVTIADVTRAAAAHLDPDRLITLVVGDLEAIGDDLRQLGLGDPVVLSAETF